MLQNPKNLQRNHYEPWILRKPDATNTQECTTVNDAYDKHILAKD